MRSLDTNVILRAVLQDDPTQTGLALDILLKPASLLPTVVLEVMWVLGGRPDWSRSRIGKAMAAIFDLPLLEVQYRESVVWALDRFILGGDFADMLHVALSAPFDSFATFDRAIARHATDAPVAIELIG